MPVKFFSQKPSLVQGHFYRQGEANLRVKNVTVVNILKLENIDSDQVIEFNFAYFIKNFTQIRSTEIRTLDRGSIIVPNSRLHLSINIGNYIVILNDK